MMPDAPLEQPSLSWVEAGAPHTASWRGEAGAFRRVEVVDDALTADQAVRLSSEGVALLWRGDYQNARQLLAAMTRRLERRPIRAGATSRESVHLLRQARGQRARCLSALLLPLDGDDVLPLRRAPDVRAVCAFAWGPPRGPAVVSLRALQGAIGAWEWYKKGVEVPALRARVHPHYGVFAPVRGEYVGLVATAPLPRGALAFDLGTGTGVLAAVLAQRGVAQVIATDLSPVARACATENLTRLGLSARVTVVEADLFPPGQAALIVCNPPWLPLRPTSRLEEAVYDPDGRMLQGFLAGLAAHLLPGGEGWLILSDLAEHLGLRTREALLSAIAAAGLQVVDRLDARPIHPRSQDASDPLHAARAAEVTSLWRLRVV